MNLQSMDRILLEKAYERVLLKEEKNITPLQPYGNFVLVLGIPGAGKSTLYKLGLINMDHIVHVSPDKWIEIYAKNKEMDLSDPEKTSELHQQISPQWRKHSQQFIANKSNRANYVMEKIGNDMDSIKTLVQQIKDLGLNLIVVLVHVNLDTALTANNQRTRKVPEKIVEDAYHKIEDTFNFLAGHTDVQQAWRIDNDQHPDYQDYRSSNFIKKIK
jgi:predicted kinase